MRFLVPFTSSSSTSRSKSSTFLLISILLFSIMRVFRASSVLSSICKGGRYPASSSAFVSPLWRRIGNSPTTSSLSAFSTAPARKIVDLQDEEEENNRSRGRVGSSAMRGYQGRGGSYQSRGGGGRGRGPPRGVDEFADFGEQMSFDTTVHDEGGETLFGDKRVSPQVVEALAAANMTTFTPIQRETYDPLFDGRDMIGRSRTGTGKTLAFGLPILEVVAKTLAEEGSMNARGRAPKVIILAPTRELAKQCDDQLSVIGRPLGLRIRTIYGGVPYERQIRDLETGFDILVGTPGRIMDHLDRGTLSLKDIRHVILDEADEMLKMGFAEDIEKIFSYFDVTQSQVLLFSATTPSWVQNIARKYLKNPINIDAVGGGNRAATTIRHIGVRVPDSHMARKNILEDVIAAHSQGGRVMVFTQTKSEADELSSSSPYAAENTRVLHGDITQRQRELTLKQFRDGFFKVLVATDVAARGIDIPEVDLVIQYRPCDDSDSYVHRSGRTGRAGRLGTSVVIYSEPEWFKLRRLENDVNIKFEKVGMPSIEDVVSGLCQAQTAKLNSVDEEVVPYFKAYATQLVQESDAPVEEMLARCLAAMTGRKLTPHRSMLTGQHGMVTITAEAEEPLKEWDVLEYVKSLYDGTDRLFIPEVKFMFNQPNVAVFDLDSSKAKAVMEKAAAGGGRMTLSLCTVMPRLENTGFRGGGRGGGGGGYQGRNGGGSGGRSFGKFGGGGGGARGSYNKGGDSWGNKRDSWSSGGGGGGRGGGGGAWSKNGSGVGKRYESKPLEYNDGDNYRGGGGGNRYAGGAGGGGRKGGDDSVDKFLESLDWP